MTCRGQNKRPKNWRASRKNQLFCYERNFRRLERIFWYYNKIKLAITQEEDRLNTFLSAHSDDGVRVVGRVSDPTARLAMNLAKGVDRVIITNEDGENETFERPYDWIKVVDETLNYFQNNDERVRDVLVRRYLLNEGSPRTCIDMELSLNQYYRARDAGLQFARECAIQIGLLRAF